MKVGKKIGKVPVLVGVCDGFVGNRMLAKRTRECGFMLEEGALPWQIDKVIYNFGFPMGPYQMGDMAGLDVGWRNRKAKFDSLTPANRNATFWIKSARRDASARRPVPVSISMTKSARRRPTPGLKNSSSIIPKKSAEPAAPFPIRRSSNARFIR